MERSIGYCLLKIEKYSASEETESLVKSLCCLCALLRVETCSLEVLKEIVSRLMAVLMAHENVEVVKSALSIISELTEDASLPSDIILALMYQVKSLLNSGGVKLTVVCELLTYLTNEKTIQMLCSSGCLCSILTIFSNIDSFEIPLKEINWIVNCIVCAISAETRMMIGEKVIPKVVNFLNIWLIDYDADATMTPILKELLFLCRCVTSRFAEGQNLFVRNGGLQSLICALKRTHKMEEHLENVVQTRNCLHLDSSPTLFSSLVMLMDVVVTHNSKACQMADILHATGILQHYLDIAPEDQQLSLVVTIVHILEADIRTPSPSLINKMCHIVKKRGCAEDVFRFLKSRQHVERNPRGKCTPHPRKSLALKTRLAADKTNSPTHHQSPSKKSNQKVEKVLRIKGTPHPNKALQLKKPLKRLENSVSDLNTKKLNSSPDEKLQSSTHASQVNLCLECNHLQVAPKPTKPKKYFFSHSDLLLLMHCIQVHGVNMDNVRRVYPVHQELTPGELYALWRALWPKKKLRRLF
ncbi:uncharacterized protein LOC117645054 [Thrips palmi]|uniref:Uncharacterized protein LOC117645054 n=1 Tax=Thrips palmi TaxID=161013 RepID=A0A6P8YTP9_THRPL|nr:uncharacterized protein LOC117645054 [Thrips palmi]